MNKVGKSGTQNRFAGKHPSYKKRKMSIAAILKKRERDKKYSDNKRRAELNKANRDKGTYGNGDKMDVTHKNGKISGQAHQSKNRGSKSDSAGDVRARGGKYKRLKKNRLK